MTEETELKTKINEFAENLAKASECLYIFSVMIEKASSRLKDSLECMPIAISGEVLTTANDAPDPPK